MTDGDLNAIWARAFFDELARAGVREICVAPGSRSTPLVLAAAGDGRFRMSSVLDERSAGFIGLGIGKASGRPGVVITTSGTAAANLYPAVVEASQGEVPLIVLTADRPHRLRDTDGNQSMDQLRLFGTFPRAFFELELPRLSGPALRHLRGVAARAVAQSLGPPPGPVHLNFPFEKPLEPSDSESLSKEKRFRTGSPLPEDPLLAFVGDHPRASAGRQDGSPFVRISQKPAEVPEGEVARISTFLARARRGIIVAGPVSDPEEVGPAVLELAAALEFPVLADPLSGARFCPSLGAQVVAGYDLFLRSPEVRKTLAPDLILRIGGSPTSAAALEYMAEATHARQIVVDLGSRWKDHLASAQDYIQASPVDLLNRLSTGVSNTSDPEWAEYWTDAETRTRGVLGGDGAGELLEGEILASIVEALPDRANLLVASSMPIRDLDAFAFPRAEGKEWAETLRVYGNRGVSGIDGLVSTAVGLALGSEGAPGGGISAPESGPTVAVLGDLAFLHDLTGLLALKALSQWVVIVVLNNDGGGIFHTLPIQEHEPAFTEFFATPHGLEFSDAGALFDLSYSRVDSLPAFQERFLEALSGTAPTILEVKTRREETHLRREGVVEAVVESMEGLGEC